MGRTRLHNTMIGRVYPFFLNNTNLQSYYLYQVNTPGISSNEVPLLSLTKISEKTMNKGEYCMREGDTKKYDLDVILLSSTIEQTHLRRFLISCIGIS